jgi:hypothetical protein
VRIKTSVKSAETIKYVTVDRKMPMAELKRLPEMETLKDDYGVSDHNVDVSPAPSANSQTSFSMKKSGLELNAAIKDDLEKSWNDKFERWKESEAPGIKAAVMEQLQGEREFTSLLMRRNVEDGVFATMNSALGDPDVSGRKISFANLDDVTRFTIGPMETFSFY